MLITDIDPESIGPVARTPQLGVYARSLRRLERPTCMLLQRHCERGMLRIANTFINMARDCHFHFEESLRRNGLNRPLNASSSRHGTCAIIQRMVTALAPLFYERHGW